MSENKVILTVLPFLHDACATMEILVDNGIVFSATVENCITEISVSSEDVEKANDLI